MNSIFAKHSGHSSLTMVLELAFCILAFSLLAGFVISAAHMPSRLKPVDSLSLPVSTNDPPTVLEDKNHHFIKADVQINGSRVLVQEEIFLKSPLKNIHLYVPARNKAQANIMSVQGSKNNTLDFDDQKSNLYIHSPLDVDQVRIQFEIHLPDNRSPLSSNQDYTLLTNFLMVPAVEKNNKTIPLIISAFGDPYLYDIANYSVTFYTKSTKTVWAPGNHFESSQKDLKVHRFQAGNIRDFPAIIFEDGKVVMEQYMGCDFYYYNAAALAPYVKEAFDFASKNLGPYPHKRLFVLSIPLNQRGMEQSTMILVNPMEKQDTQTRRDVVIHEILHQWFYGMIGTDQVNEPFLDEGLVSFLTDFHLQRDLTAKGLDKPALKKLSAYKNAEEYYQKAYYESRDYFLGLYKKNPRQFWPMLQKIYQDKQGTILYYDELKQYIKTYLGGF